LPMASMKPFKNRAKLGVSCETVDSLTEHEISGHSCIMDSVHNRRVRVHLFRLRVYRRTGFWAARSDAATKITQRQLAVTRLCVHCLLWWGVDRKWLL
jgi:hypothetical protein